MLVVAAILTHANALFGRMLQRSLIVVTLPPRDTTVRETPVLENVRMCILCTDTSVCLVKTSARTEWGYYA